MFLFNAYEDCLAYGYLRVYVAFDSSFILCFSNKEEQQKSIFIKSERGGFKLKENVQFHLYISTSPCGDARIFSPHEAAQEGMTAALLTQGTWKDSLSTYRWHS